jgi:hypothetical protein
MSQLSRAVLFTAALMLTQGCYHSRVVIDAQGATEYQSQAVNSYFWGLVQENVQPSNCASQAMQEVGVSWNLGYALLTIVTLGVYSPVEVEWRCAKQTPPSVEDLP